MSWQEDRDLLAAATRAVRAADQAFQKVGGSSRHWIRECFFPQLAEHGLAIVRQEQSALIADLAEALEAQWHSKMPDGSLCFCETIHDLDFRRIGHEEDCIAARAALARVAGEKGTA